MSFSCAELERYYDAQVVLRGKYEGLAAAYSGKHFENMEARAFARQGFPRRLELMQHCIESSMEAFPPRISWTPGPFGILDATVCLQAFVLNVQGCIDNLAHIWVREKGLIPTVIDQNPCAHLRMPRDMIFHGWSMRLFQAWQHSATMSS